MAVDMYLYFEGGTQKAEGETQDDTYSKKKACDVLAWSWGISQSGTFHSGGGGGAGKANFQDLSVTKWVDTMSPILQYACAVGDHFDKAYLVVRKAGTAQNEYMEYTFTKVLITSVSTGGSGGEDRLTENVSLNFAEVEYKYTPQDEKGKKGKPIEFKYDIAKMKTK
ncbi:type VI secretion system tube protein Hcp [Mangrovicoccus sp. HB161399]|uniref:Hcp family type VI secretion system effector n=1 Tax=Mangrovicoccus sp. HB161399 TaxID=2720392 RepID=UPI001554A6D2|nr:type VI secretion system tube protein Hcp [Mangrovicoccus sp. HB161399]